MRGRLLACALAVLALLLTTARADAWYFPEHVVLASDGHARLAPELRAIIADAVADARKEGLTLCERTDLRLEDALRDTPLLTPMLRTPASVACVPYATLAGLAGDHASDVTELRAVLTSAKGVELVSAVAYEWRRFQDSVLRGQASLDRMAFVHELDVALYFIDTGYVTRARATRVHFRDAGRSFESVLRDLGVQGQVDEVVARFAFHHMRSFGLAARGKRVEALLEHAFAVHFLEDAFASGHLVMSPGSWGEGRDAVRWRHDAFNADGLRVTRAMSREPCSSLATGTVELAGLPPCWTTTGDGHLGLTPDTSDRLHAAAAISRAEVAFAMALDPDRLVAFAAGLGDRGLMAVAATLDPNPWWTVDSDTRRRLPAGRKHAMRLVRTAAAAVAKLRDLPVPPPAGVDVARVAGAIDPAIITGALAVPVIADEDGEDGAAEAVTMDAASIGVSLLRPTLVEVPTPQADTATMHPEGHLDHGWALQLFASAGTTMLVPPAAPVDFIGPGVGVSAGVSYRWGTLLPGRRARAIAEFNVGVSETLHVDSHGDTHGSAHLTMLDQELRWPIVWEALTTYTLPLNLAAMHRAGRLLFVNGVRAHEVARDGSVAFLGAELEACAVALSDGHGSHPLYSVSPELRFYVGLANPSAAQPSFPNALGVTFGIALTGGYATFF